MPSRRLALCRLCGAKVRKDLILSHRERVHPRELSPVERDALKAKDEERAKRAKPPTPSLSIPTTASDKEDSPFNDLVEPWRPPRDQVAPPPGVDPALWEKLRTADEMLLRRCGDRLLGEEEEDEQVRWESHLHAQWLSRIEPDRALVGAVAHLAEADLPKYRKVADAGFEQRRASLAAPLGVFRDAGERAVPYLAGAMTTEGWAGILAVELLAEMPSTPLRNQALVEALFLPGEWAPEAAERATRSIDAARRWSLFEEVARNAQGGGIELQSVYWTSLFEERLEEELQHRPLPDLERAAILLYDLGHHSALVAGMEFLLDPWVSGEARVEANIKEGGLERVLAIVAEREPERRPNRPLVAE
ncbi:MAG: hypothetical protein KGJ23_10510 [Euryarchaeota archaeon]|nr:hypothetical protein [Euryarchaeota archaeon]MDE1837037.1 hypothetical protein [Euryarchaeota archaeon]MDE1879887.1 hypothetical protein [Euryarchaeota archaeon]MDE2045695.1 hypothetical protein [Thermoplasmata archaeon]